MGRLWTRAREDTLAPMRDPLSLDVVNYALPIPRDAATLTALGLLFDRVIFPGVYIPISDYDEEGYERELIRLRPHAP